MDYERHRSNRPLIIAIVAGSVLIALSLAIGLGVGLRDNNDNKEDNNNINSDDSTTPAYKSSTGTYKHAAVVANSKVSSDIGVDILARKRGNAIDAAVAAQLATCLMNSQSCGIGGGSFIVLYDSESGEWHAVDSREIAPAAASEDMYADDIQASLDGGKASGVPGEVLGLWEIHKKFGKLPWSAVVEPSIRLCEDGVPFTSINRKAVAGRLDTEKMKQDFSPYFDEAGNVKPEGSRIKLPKLAQTFRTIADNPASFYNGVLAENIVKDLQEEGGIITIEDMKNYRVKWKTPTMLPLPRGYKLYSMPAPGSGPVLSYILNILAGYNISQSDVATKKAEILTYHRIIEAFKFAYAKRTEMGDEDFVDVAQLVKDMTSLEFGEATRAQIDDSKTQSTEFYHPSAALIDDHGTSHLCVIDGQGSAVAITSSINTYFGSKVKGSLTGIVFNNVMNDFSMPNVTNYFGLPPSPTNFIRPGKCPQSSMSPSLIWDETNKKVRMVTGAAGGSKITTATALNIIDVLWLGRSLPASIDRPRFHHQLMPTSVQLEKGFPKDIEEGLKAKGHETEPMRFYSVVHAINVDDNGKIVGTADYRKGGQPAGF